MLWVNPRFHDTIKPLVTSLAVPGFQDDFMYQGTDDFSSFYSTKKAVEFYNNTGGMVSGVTQAGVNEEL